MSARSRGSGAGPSVWNLANGLTAGRLLAVPVFAWLLSRADQPDSGWLIAAAVVFMLAAVTDSADGEIARRRGTVTDVGKIADPIADKALIGAALIGLSMLGELWWWVTVVVLVREVGITLVRFVIIRHGVLPAGRGGKAKTAAQVVAIALFLLPLRGWADGVAVAIMGLAVALTVLSGADYLRQARRLRADSLSAAAAASAAPRTSPPAPVPLPEPEPASEPLPGPVPELPEPAPGAELGR